MSVCSCKGQVAGLGTYEGKIDMNLTNTSKSFVRFSAAEIKDYRRWRVCIVTLFFPACFLLCPFVHSFLFVCLFFVLFFCCCCWPPRLPSGKASASRAEDPGFESCLRLDFSGVESYQWLKIGTPVATLPDVLAPGLVGPVSVYCDWVRWKVWFATSISVWKHVKLSEQIRPWDTLACCWDVK